jgi:hypothetical protein
MPSLTAAQNPSYSFVIWSATPMAFLFPSTTTCATRRLLSLGDASTRRLFRRFLLGQPRWAVFSRFQLRLANFQRMHSCIRHYLTTVNFSCIGIRNCRICHRFLMRPPRPFWPTKMPKSPFAISHGKGGASASDGRLFLQTSQHWDLPLGPPLLCPDPSPLRKLRRTLDTVPYSPDGENFGFRRIIEIHSNV